MIERKVYVYHFCHPPTSPVLLIVARLLRSTKGGPIFYPMNPQQPQVCLIRSNRLPMKPVTPEGPARRCVKVWAWQIRWIEKEKKPLRRNRNNGLNRWFHHKHHTREQTSQDSLSLITSSRMFDIKTSWRRIKTSFCAIHLLCLYIKHVTYKHTHTYELPLFTDVWEPLLHRIRPFYTCTPLIILV
jgi:hypothetical protein